MPPKRPSPTKRKPERKPWEGRCCRECGNVSEVTRFHTLSVKDRKPTLGKCPFYMGGKFCVLLSSPACKEHFVLRTDGNTEGDKPEGQV